MRIKASCLGIISFFVLLSSCSKDITHEFSSAKERFSSLSYFRCLPLPGCADTTVYEFEFENGQIERRYENGILDKEYYTDDEGRLMKIKQFLRDGDFISDSISYNNGQIDTIYGFSKLGVLVVIDAFEWSDGELQRGYTTGPAIILDGNSYNTAVNEFWFEFEYLNGNIAEVIRKSKIRGYDEDTTVTITTYEYSEQPNHVRFYHRTHTGRKISISNAPLYFSKNFLAREIRHRPSGTLWGEKIYKLSNIGDSELLEESWDFAYGNAGSNRVDTTYEYYSFLHE